MQPSLIRDLDVPHFFDFILENNRLALPIKANCRDLWNAEYANCPSIPSSHRSQSSHALVELSKKFDFKKGNALDIGCGNGRNAFFLAQAGMKVTALDFSETALDILASSPTTRLIGDSVKTVNHDINDGLPFEDESFDLILDSYCLCHFTDQMAHKRAMDECRRILKPKGVLIKVHLDDNDQYYLERIEQKTEFGHISYDSINGFRKLHCNVESYLKFFAKGFEFINSLDIRFLDNVRGKEYMRSIFVSVIKKN